jgi:tetratricopeptide (TPR) repeat protein
MKVDVIDRLEEFQALKDNFDFVYSADPQARFFVSWVWLSGILKRHDEQEEPWLILAAKPETADSDYVAFFPLVVELHEDHDNHFYNQLSVAGVTDADHAPFIMVPDYQHDAIAAFAVYLKHREEWSVLRIDNVELNDERLRLLLAQFSDDQFDLQEEHHFSDLDDIDNDIVPFISLPDDWDDYLQTHLSSNSRQRIKRLLRAVEDSDEYRITLVDADNLESHITILCQLWQSSWEGRKGADDCQRILKHIDFSLHHCFENNCLYLPVLWKQDRPLGAIANLLDIHQKTMLFLVGARDSVVNDIPSGIVLHASSIRFAIQNGFKIYNFLIGNEAYKFSFGAQARHIRSVSLQRQGLAHSSRKLDVRTIPYALQIATAYHRANRLSEAEHRYRQVLATQPTHADALYGLGVVLQRQGNYPAAETVLKTLLDRQPDYIKAWFSLGTLHQMQEQLQAAETAYRQALAIEPTSPAISMAIYHNLGYTLQQQGKWEEAIACYGTARTLQPDSLEADAIWADAMHAQGKLSADECTHYAAINQTLGNHRRQAGDFQVAIEYYRQAIAMQPDLVNAHYHLGVAWHSIANWQEAIAGYQTVLALQPMHREAEASLAAAQHALGQLSPTQQMHYASLCMDLGAQSQRHEDVEAAMWFYRQAIALQPNLATAHSSLGALLHNLEQWEEAIACYQTALALQPHDHQTDMHLATALHALGRLPVDQQIHYASLNYERGNQCYQAGDLTNAIKHYQQALMLNPALVAAREPLRLALQERHEVQIKVSCVKR